eukprot:scaffold1786_cov250-Pinguiococcus_pyrenoidosus.AAC.8
MKLALAGVRRLGATSLRAQRRGISNTVFMGGLRPEVTVEDIEAALSEYGQLVHVNAVRTKQETYAFVHFNDPLASMAALDELHQRPFLGSLPTMRFMTSMADPMFREAYHKCNGDIDDMRRYMLAAEREKVAATGDDTETER